jgi:hypothetical protein
MLYQGKQFIMFAILGMQDKIFLEFCGFRKVCPASSRLKYSAALRNEQGRKFDN